MVITEYRRQYLHLWYSKYKEQHNTHTKQYYRDHRLEYKIYCLRYQRKNKEMHNYNSRKYVINNPEKRKQSYTIYNHKRSLRTKIFNTFKKSNKRGRLYRME